MSKPNLNDIIKMKLEDEIMDDKMAMLKVDRCHWMHDYFQRRYEEKVERWEKMTGRKYEHTNS